MLIGEFLRTAWRRWYVVVGGAALTVAALVLFTDRPPLYTSRVTLTVISPPPPGGSSSLQQPVPAVIASTAVMRVNGRPHELHASAAETLLVGRTQAVGDDVRLAHFGNQWTATALYPTIIVEAVDVSDEAVQTRVNDRVAEVRAAMATLEKDLGVSRSQRVTLNQSPPVAPVSFVPTSRPRAAAGTGLVGIGLTCWGVSWADSWLRRREGRRS